MIVALVAVVAGLLALSVRQMIAANADRRRVLHRFQGQPMTIVTETSGNISHVKRVVGRISSVDRSGVAVEGDAGVIFIPITAVRAIEALDGREVARWR